MSTDCTYYIIYLFIGRISDGALQRDREKADSMFIQNFLPRELPKFASATARERERAGRQTNLCSGIFLSSGHPILHKTTISHTRGAKEALMRVKNGLAAAVFSSARALHCTRQKEAERNLCARACVCVFALYPLRRRKEEVYISRERANELNI